MAFSPGDHLDQYRIVGTLGEGGMGRVYRAVDTELEREVAIKVVRPDLADDRERLDRFVREARTAGSLNHPNILTVYELGTHENQPFIVTELLEGESLREVIGKGGLTTRTAVQYGEQIAAGLSAAHEKGITHRDLKPENLLVTSDGRIKILDFGLAKLMRRGAPAVAPDAPTATVNTAAGTVLGSAAYMSPEQVRGEEADHRSDIFSLGVVLYEMLGSARPFEGSSTVEAMSSILRDDPPPLSSRSREIPPTLEGVVTRCLEKRPQDRFQSADDLAFALRQSVATSPRRTRSVWIPLAITLAVVLVTMVAIVQPWKNRGPGAELPPIRSIAVLPLADLSGDPEQEYFADGMTDELILNLARIEALDVISRTSAMRYKGSDKPLPQIARELGVDAIVEGTVTRSAGNVRITVQLVHGETDRHLWAESYHRAMRDVLLLQGDVARAVAREIDIAVTPEEVRRLADAPPVDPEAHEAYLRGIYHFQTFTGEGLRKAKEHLERAVELDPGYADAQTALSAVEVNSLYFLSLPPTEVIPRTRRRVEAALASDPDNPKALLMTGWIQMVYDWNWEGAERNHLRALQTGPGLFQVQTNHALFLACRGRFDEAVFHARRAEQLDPLSLLSKQHVGMILYLAHRYDEAITQLERTIELDPNFWFAYQRLAMVLRATGEYDRGIEVMKKGNELIGPHAGRAGEHTLATLLAASGRRPEALEILEKLEEQARTSYRPPSDIAQIHLSLGDTDEAFRWLDTAIEVRDGDLFMLPVSPLWDPLRDDPRFDEILRRLNVPED